ncbi:MAG TPA: hypothetical protein VMS88_02055, partial [Terriglobales bacterium]|nr:hypothetical protein [Terriglobales bacterium]
MSPKRVRQAAAALVTMLAVAWRPHPAGSAVTGGRAPAGAGLASLVTQVEPDNPWVGQPVLLRVRLLLGRDLAEEPSYAPPVTNGFWAEGASLPQSYASVQDGRRVLVTETRARMYPLTPGIAHVGAASADLVFAEDAASSALRDEAPGRRVTVWSQPIGVRVRPLPPSAPPGFGGAVGALSVGWSADRAATSQDVPVTVRLDVRGVGNLPLLETPTLVCPDGEVYAGTTDDSLPQAGTLTPGRRRFQWNVLAKRIGTLRISAPPFAWFDPASATYRTAAPAPVAVTVGPPLFARFQGGESFPGVFLRDAPDPFARGVAPWLWVLAGILGGGAVLVGRLRPPPDAAAGERARVAGWRNALRAPAGPAFWRAAEEVTDWLERRGRDQREARAAVEGTRYGGGAADADAVRTRLTKELAAALPAPPAKRRTRTLAFVLGGVALAVVVLSSLRFGEGAASRL